MKIIFLTIGLLSYFIRSKSGDSLHIHTSLLKSIEFQLYTVIIITAKNRCSALFVFYVTAWRADCIILQDDRCIALSHLPWCWRPRNYSVVKWSWWQIVWVRMDLLSVGRALLLAVTDWWAEASGKKQEGRLLLSGSLSTVSCLPPSCVSLCLFHTYCKTPPQHANRWLGARKSRCICVSERPRCQNTHIRHRQWQRHWNTSAGDDAMMDCLCQCQNIQNQPGADKVQTYSAHVWSTLMALSLFTPNATSVWESVCFCVRVTTVGKCG